MRSSARRIVAVLTALIAVFAFGPQWGSAPASAAEPLPDAVRIVVTLADDRIAAVDPASGAMTAVAPLSGIAAAPHPDVVVDPTVPVLYVPAGDEIAIVDAGTLTETGRLADPGGSTFTSIAVSPDGERLYGLTVDQHVVGFDLATGTALPRVPTSAPPAITMPRQLAADDTAAYVVAGAVVDVIARDATTVTSQITLAGTAGALALDPLARRLYAVQASPAVTDIAVVDLDAGVVVGNPEHLLPLTMQPIVLSANGLTLVTGTTNPDEAQSFNTALQEPGGTRAVLPGPIGVPVVAPDNAAVYVPVRGTASIVAFTGVFGARSGEFTLPAPVLAAAAVRAAAVGGPTAPPSAPAASAAPTAPAGPDTTRPALAESGVDPLLPPALLLIAAGLTLALVRWPTSRRRSRAPHRSR
jgi:hypothetical protein